MQPIAMFNVFESCLHHQPSGDNDSTFKSLAIVRDVTANVCLNDLLVWVEAH